MKKFSKITESAEFLGWSKDRLTKEFKELDPIYLDIDTLYIHNGGGSLSSSDVYSADDIERMGDQKKDFIYAPFFLIDMVLGRFPKDSDVHEKDNILVDNWVDESIKFDIVKEQFDKLSNFVDQYRDDFHITIEINPRSGPNQIGLAVLRSGEMQGILKLGIGLIMKDYFEYDQIMSNK